MATKNQSTTIVLSGPGGFRSQVITAMEKGGYKLVDLPAKAPRLMHSHGLPDHTTGLLDPTVGWLTFTGNEVDSAQAIAARLQWALRMHHPTPAPTPVDPIIELLGSHEKRFKSLELALAQATGKGSK